MSALEDQIRGRLRAESADGPPSNLVERVSRTLRDRTGNPRPMRRRAPMVSVIAAATVVLVALAAAALANRATDRGSAGPPDPAAAPTTSVLYSPEELDVATEHLFVASRKGSLPMISYIRSAADRSGLIVGVSRRVSREYRHVDQLAKTFTDETGIPTQIEIGEAPRDGIPINPSTPN